MLSTSVFRTGGDVWVRQEPCHQFTARRQCIKSDTPRAKPLPAPPTRRPRTPRSLGQAVPSRPDARPLDRSPTFGQPSRRPPNLPVSSVRHPNPSQAGQTDEHPATSLKTQPSRGPRGRWPTGMVCPAGTDGVLNLPKPSRPRERAARRRPGPVLPRFNVRAGYPVGGGR